MHLSAHLRKDSGQERVGHKVAPTQTKSTYHRADKCSAMQRNTMQTRQAGAGANAIMEGKKQMWVCAAGTRTWVSLRPEKVHGASRMAERL